MERRPPILKRTDTLFPCTTLCRARVDVGEDRHDVRFGIVDARLDLLGLEFVAFGARGVEVAEQAAEFAGVGLTQEGVGFLDQRRNASLFVHRLVGQRTEFAAQRRDHPAREVDVRSEEHTSELQSLMRTSYAVFCLQKKK